MGAKYFRRAICAVCCVVSLLVCGAVHAQSYPTRTIHLVVGFPPGGANDVLARLLAPRLGAALDGASVIVENRAGADGIIGTGYVSQAAPDGYTLGLSGLSALVLSTFTYKDLAYNPLADFAGVSTVASSPILFAIKPSLPIHSFAELIAYAKANPGKLSFVTVGNGGSTRMMFELFRMTTGADVQYVTYKGAAQGLTDLLGGRLDAMAIDFPVLYPLVKQGKLRALATTGTERSPLLPDVPTMGELGFPKLTQGNWYALVAPPHTPPEIVTRLNAAIRKLEATDEMKKVFIDNGLEAMTQESPEAFLAFLKSQIDRWGEVVKTAGIQRQ